MNRHPWAVLVLSAAAVSLVGCSTSPEAGPPTTSTSASQLPPASASPSAPEPPTLKELVGSASNGVVRIETTTCELWGGGSGSGFLVDDDLVATVAHVVDGARTVSLRTTEGVIRGEVIGSDLDREVALVRAVRPLGGHEFVFATESPEVTDQVAVLGFPRGLPLTTTLGSVSALDRRVEFETQSLDGLIQTDAAINGGNSGGPMINGQGEVVGLVEAKNRDSEGLAYAVPAGVARDLVTAWAASPDSTGGVDCPAATEGLITIESIHPDAPAIAEAFYVFVAGINEEWYGESWGMLTGRRRGAYGSLEDFAREQSSSMISDFVLEKASRKDETSDTADVRFTSTQDPAYGPDGQSCSQWHLRYTMRMDSGRWLIDAAKNLGDSPTGCLDE